MFQSYADIIIKEITKLKNYGKNLCWTLYVRYVLYKILWVKNGDNLILSKFGFELRCPPKWNIQTRFQPVQIAAQISKIWKQKWNHWLAVSKPIYCFYERFPEAKSKRLFSSRYNLRTNICIREAKKWIWNETYFFGSHFPLNSSFVLIWRPL